MSETQPHLTDQAIEQQQGWEVEPAVSAEQVTADWWTFALKLGLQMPGETSTSSTWITPFQFALRAQALRRISDEEWQTYRAELRADLEADAEGEMTQANLTVEQGVPSKLLRGAAERAGIDGSTFMQILWGVNLGSRRIRRQDGSDVVYVRAGQGEWFQLWPAATAEQSAALAPEPAHTESFGDRLLRFALTNHP